MSQPDAVRYERRGSAALITIDRQHRRNAVDGPTAAALHEAYLRFEDDDEARVLVLTGAGELAFCAGADLKATETIAGRLDSAEGPMGFTRLTPSKPTIAAISGYCLAGGLELALWCDLRIAAETAMLGYPERRWGVPLIDGGTQRLPRIVGLGRALDMILTGRMVPAAEALAMGLVNRVVAPDALEAEALAFAARLAAGAPLAVRYTKQAVNKLVKDALNTAFDTATALEIVTFQSEDHREALAALREKRPPVFKGR